MWKRHRRYAADGTCNTVLATLLGHAQASGRIGWEVPVDAASNRAHQHGTNLLRRPDHHDPLTGRRLAAPAGGDGRTRAGRRFPDVQVLVDALNATSTAAWTTRRRAERAVAAKASPSRGKRKLRRERGIGCVIPNRDVQTANRKRKGSAGGRPVSHDEEAYKRRNVVGCLARPGLPLGRGAPCRAHLGCGHRESTMG